MLTLADLTATSGARLGFPVAEGAAPSILVGGTPALNGAHLDVAIADLANQRSTSFLALTAQKGPSVSNTDVTMSSSTIVPILKQDPNSLFVVLLDMQVPLAPVATKPNTAAAGAAIDRVKGNATGDLGAVVRELTALDDRALALEMVAGEIHASRLQLALIDSESFTDLVRTGLMDRTHERERAATGWGGQRLRCWGQLSGKRAKFDATHLSEAEPTRSEPGVPERARRLVIGRPAQAVEIHAARTESTATTEQPAIGRAPVEATRTGAEIRNAATRSVAAAPHGLHPIPNDASSLRRCFLRNSARRRSPAGSIAKPRATRPRSSATSGGSTTTASMSGPIPWIGWSESAVRSLEEMDSRNLEPERCRCGRPIRSSR